MHILLIEDDLNLSRDLQQQLLLEHFQVDVAYDGLLAEKFIKANSYDCIVMDVNIPGKNGYELTKAIREKQITSPIILITAFGEIEDKLEGFTSGADDYITKPFYFKELLARIRVFIKRSENYKTETEQLVIENLVIDMAKKEVYRGNVSIRLTAREFTILKVLAEAKGNPVSKKDLIQKVWNTNFDANTNTIEVFINVLRNKIDKNFEPKLIKTRIGYGYFLEGG